ncbi:MAG TPA: tetratricopeptide repeat protein [Candidatus Hydrogenedentes bacterium]|nr:tetratricopeptide repeat protein [Candidatus Hydrogenedentota bacterium]
MGKRFGKSAKSYARNLGIHLRRVVTRQESPGEALTEVSRDSKKLGHALKKGRTKHYRSRAVDFAKRGREAYNAKDYASAAKLFRRAVRADEGYGLARLYLGNALYKLDSLREAMMAWEAAIEFDPGSDAAAKARRRLQHVGDKRLKVLERLQDRNREDQDIVQAGTGDG